MMGEQVAHDPLDSAVFFECELDLDGDLAVVHAHQSVGPGASTKTRGRAR